MRKTSLKEGDLFGIRALESGYFGGVAQSRPQSSARSRSVSPRGTTRSPSPGRSLPCYSPPPLPEMARAAVLATKSHSSMPVSYGSANLSSIRMPSPLCQHPVVRTPSGTRAFRFSYTSPLSPNSFTRNSAHMVLKSNNIPISTVPNQVRIGQVDQSLIGQPQSSIGNDPHSRHLTVFGGAHEVTTMGSLQRATSVLDRSRGATLAMPAKAVTRSRPISAVGAWGTEVFDELSETLHTFRDDSSTSGSDSGSQASSDHRTASSASSIYSSREIAAVDSSASSFYDRPPTSCLSILQLDKHDEPALRTSSSPAQQMKTQPLSQTYLVENVGPSTSPPVPQKSCLRQKMPRLSLQPATPVLGDPGFARRPSSAPLEVRELDRPLPNPPMVDCL